MIKVNYEASISNDGNHERLHRLFERARKGEKLNIGFLGGSITMGSVATKPELCYAHRVFDWFVKTFPNSEFNYINAGIGATDSHFGVARCDKDLLAYKPDFVIIEFSVNDDSSDHFKETYEGLVRRVYSSGTSPAVFVVHNVMYDNGYTAEGIHSQIVKHYDLPSCSMKSTIYQEVMAGNVVATDIFPDNLHPNDDGHELVASIITWNLERIASEDFGDLSYQGKTDLPAPLTTNGFENSKRYRNDNSSPIVNEFFVDEAIQDNITDIFKMGWMASTKGASITFNVEGSSIAIIYRKTKELPAPIAKAILDDDEENALILDANFDETWGDKLYVDMLLEHGNDKMHTVKIVLDEVHEEDVLPFYLNGLIVSR